jgi:large subunit ribosomal protein L20
MTRVKRGNVSRKRHKKVLSFTKGFRGAASVLFRTANQQNMKALRYAYANRRKKKRSFRRLWITRFNAALRANGFNYSEFVFFLKNAKIAFNRKVCAQFAVCDPETFVLFVQSLQKNT